MPRWRTSAARGGGLCGAARRRGIEPPAVVAPSSLKQTQPHNPEDIVARLIVCNSYVTLYGHARRLAYAGAMVWLSHHMAPIVSTLAEPQVRHK